jgi:hypothetical protein
VIAQDSFMSIQLLVVSQNMTTMILTTTNI